MSTLSPEKEAELRVRRYVQMRTEKPLRGVADSIHGLHTGTEWEAELKLADLRNVLSLLSTERQAREAAEKEVERLTRERDIALDLHQDALRLAGTDVTEAYQIGRGLRPSPFESGWLIEGWDSKRNAFKAEWWSLDLPGTEDGHGWTKDKALALRFARERDAQDYINDIGWTEAKPTEHGWGKSVSALPPPVPTEEADRRPKWGEHRGALNVGPDGKCPACGLVSFDEDGPCCGKMWPGDDPGSPSVSGSPTQAPQDVAGLVEREALIKLIREELTDRLIDTISLTGQGRPDVLRAGCKAVGYSDPEDAASKFASFLADRFLALRTSPISHESKGLELAAADNNHKALVEALERIAKLKGSNGARFIADDALAAFQSRQDGKQP